MFLDQFGQMILEHHLLITSHEEMPQQIESSGYFSDKVNQLKQWVQSKFKKQKIEQSLELDKNNFMAKKLFRRYKRIENENNANNNEANFVSIMG